MKVQVQTIKDIRDKELKYLVIGEGANKVVINVGKKTYDAVESLLAVQDGKIKLIVEEKNTTKTK